MVNIGNMMKQAQELQKKMSEAQEKLKSIEVEGSSGGGLVKVLSSAKGEIKKISIDDSLMKKEEKEITEDLILAATKPNNSLSNDDKFIFGLLPFSVITSIFISLGISKIILWE